MKKYKKRAVTIDFNRLYFFSNCLNLDRRCPECKYYEICKQHAVRFLKLPREDQHRKVLLRNMRYKKYGVYSEAVRDSTVAWMCLDVLKPCRGCYRNSDCLEYLEELGYDEEMLKREVAMIW